MDLPALIEKFGSEEKCREYLEALRWPDGVECRGARDGRSRESSR